MDGECVCPRVLFVCGLIKKKGDNTKLLLTALTLSEPHSCSTAEVSRETRTDCVCVCGQGRKHHRGGQEQSAKPRASLGFSHNRSHSSLLMEVIKVLFPSIKFIVL